MELAVTIESPAGLSWPHWKRLVTEVEALGFAGLFMSDHIVPVIPVEADTLELTVALTYLAGQSQRLHFGSMVSPLSFRDPVFLARQAMALDDLSNGRMVLGVGAGWAEREHTMFGYDLGDVPTRLDRFEEGLAVISQLIRSDDPVTFSGKFYRLQEARLLPRPQRATPILVGGIGPKRVLPLVARYADIWNCHVSVELFRERSALLDDLLRAEGRQPGEVKRTLMLPVICWRDEAELTRRLDFLRSGFPGFAPMSNADILAFFRTGIVGTPDEVIAGLNAYAAAGVDEFIVQWFGVADIDGLAILADQILPHFRS